LLAFISEKSSTSKSSTNQDLSSLKQLSTTCSSGATFPPRAPENLQELWPDQPSAALYTDASGTTGWGSVLEPSHEATRSSAGWWASQELLEMIALKELKALRHGLHQNVETLRGRTVKLYQDNQTVCGALRKMSSKCPALMAEIKDLVPWLHENKIRLDVVYSTGR
jgi:hypothetical protein